MSAPHAVFRFDATPALGIGHAMRCLTLADELAARGWVTTFATNADAPTLVPGLQARRVVTPQPGCDPMMLGRAIPERCQLLVVDHYGLDATYEQGCLPFAERILVIDDLADRPHACDLLLDQTHGRDGADYGGLATRNARLLMGASFALLRPEFAALRSRAEARRKDAAPATLNLLISLGGTDPTGASLDAIAGAGLCRFADSLALTVVLGAASPHLDAVRQALAPWKERARLHPGSSEMARLMLDADLAIGAAGSTSWERCCLGLPTLMLVTADNQQTIAANLQTTGAARSLGRHPGTTPTTIGQALDDLCQPAVRQAMSQAAFAVTDGRGAERVADACEQVAGS